MLCPNPSRIDDTPDGSQFTSNDIEPVLVPTNNILSISFKLFRNRTKKALTKTFESQLCITCIKS